MSLRYLGPTTLLLGFLVFSTGKIVADTADENKLKMALVFNFARYTEWPSTVPAKTLTFCVFDNEELMGEFAALKGKMIKERKVLVHHVSLKDNSEVKLADCQLLFISSRERKLIALALAQVVDKPVLTIGQLPDFIDSGGIINLYVKNEKLRFAISPRAAHAASLRISARLLQVAKIVDN